MARLQIAALYLAAGIDPSKSKVFIQSHITAHAELCWLLNCVTPMGWMEKMIQYKDKVCGPAPRRAWGVCRRSSAEERGSVAGPSGFERSAAAAAGRPAARRHAPQTTKQKSFMPAALHPRPRLTHVPRAGRRRSRGSRCRSGCSTTRS